MKALKTTIFTIILASFSQLCFAQITNVNPNQGNRGQTLPIIISGTVGNFSQGTNTNIWLQQGSFVISQGSNIQNVIVVTSSEISADLSVPTNAPLGMFDVGVWSQGTAVIGSSLFEVKGGTSTTVSLKVGGGKPGDIVNEEVTWAGIDLTGQTITKMWLSKDGNTITSLSNPTVILKDSEVGVTIQIPTWAAQGYWSANLITNTGQILMSPAAFLVDVSFAVDDYNLKASVISVYPNPTSDKLVVRFEFDNFKATQIRILDITGKTILNKTQNANQNIAELKVTNLPSGTYFLQVLEGQKVLSTEKFIKN